MQICILGGYCFIKEGDEKHIPPYPVSASAMTGMDRSRLAIIPALSRISLRVASPRSAIPSRDIVVPAPVYDPFLMNEEIQGDYVMKLPCTSIRSPLSGPTGR